jgi:hypothetical protein
MMMMMLMMLLLLMMMINLMQILLYMKLKLTIFSKTAHQVKEKST